MLGNKTVTAASVYFPGDAEVISPIFNELVQRCAARKAELIVACDVNAHHTHWGSTDINARGEEFLAYVCASDLLFCNRGGTPTFDNGRRTEVVNTIPFCVLVGRFCNQVGQTLLWFSPWNKTIECCGVCAVFGQICIQFGR